MFDWIADPGSWVALATLTLLEIVLGIDNIVFVSILTGRLPKEQQSGPAASVCCWRWACGSPCCSRSVG
jgi:hypothetical protein